MANASARGELRQLEDFGRLPSRYGDAVRLCYLEGLALKDAAFRLGCPVGTVGSRLTRAKDLLRSRLIRRGLAPAAIAIVSRLETHQCRVAVPDALVRLRESLLRKAAPGWSRRP
jgi:RNA polymerase sigma-70 factor (ECF subfamily)